MADKSWLFSQQWNGLRCFIPPYITGVTAMNIHAIMGKKLHMGEVWELQFCESLHKSGCPWSLWWKDLYNVRFHANKLHRQFRCHSFCKWLLDPIAHICKIRCFICHHWLLRLLFITVSCFCCRYCLENIVNVPGARGNPKRRNLVCHVNAMSTSDYFTLFKMDVLHR